jgi:hypothetical protein
MIKLKEEVMDFSEISSGYENETVSLRNSTGTRGAVATGVEVCRISIVNL